MAKARIGHFVEAQVLEALGVDYIDESEVLTPADEEHHIDKHDFKVPFVCGARDLGEALRRIGEGAAMIRSKGEPGTGNIVEAVRHLRAIVGAIKQLTVLGPGRVDGRGEEPRRAVRAGPRGRPGGQAAGRAVLRRRRGHPGRRRAGDAAWRRGRLRRLRHLQEPRTRPGRRQAIVKATTHFRDAGIIAEVSKGLGEAMPGIELGAIPERELMAPRGW